MKVAYILSRYPVLTETFIKVELQTILGDGIDLRVYPLRGAQDTAWVIDSQPDGGIGDRVRRFGFSFSARNLGAMLAEAFASPRLFAGGTKLFLKASPGGFLGVAKALFILPKACRIVRDIRRWAPDHVHAHFANLPATVAAFTGHLLGISCSYTSHAFDIYGRDEASLKQLTEVVDFVATISERNRAFYGSVVSPEAAAKVQIVHCGVDLQSFAAVGPGDGPLVSVGRLVPKKGFRYLVEAIAELANRGIAARCKIIGEGEQRQELADLISHHNLDDQIELAGPQPPEVVREALAQSAAFVLPCVEAADGDVDGIPVSLMEAMAMEKVVLTTDISGIAELVTDGEDGLLVKQRNSIALADALAPLLTGEFDAARIGQRARVEVAAEFDCRTNARRLVSFMQDPATDGKGEGR